MEINVNEIWIKNTNIFYEKTTKKKKFISKCCLQNVILSQPQCVKLRAIAHQLSETSSTVVAFKMILFYRLCVTTFLSSKFPKYYLTHWGWVIHICLSKQTITDSDNGLLPGQRQVIIWTNAGILLIRPLQTNFSEILFKIHTFSFKKMHLKISSGIWGPFCLSLDVLTH